MTRRGSKRPAIARTAAALLLALAFVCAATPLASVSAGSVCQLECCAGRMAHAAGSCMNGTCHAGLKIQGKLRRSQQFASVEEFCGLKRLFKRSTYTAPATDSTNDESFARLVKLCDADCGSCAVGSVSAKGKIAAANPFRLQPLSKTRLTGCDQISSDEVFQRQYSPRGPPITSS